MKTQENLGAWSIIRPEARARWMSRSLASLTPRVVESILRGAMSGSVWQQAELFDLMEETWPRLAKNLAELKDEIAGLDWTLQPWSERGEKPTPEADRRAQLIEGLLWQMRPRPGHDEFDFEETVWNLLDARGKGIAVLEIDWEAGGGGRAGRKAGGASTISPRCTHLVDARFYRYATSGEDRLVLDLTQIRTLGGGGAGLTDLGDGTAEIPEDKLIVGVCKAKSGHPIGSALLRTLGFWWAASNFTADWFLNFAQLFGQPMRWATYDPSLSAGDKTTLGDMLANMGSAAWAMFPAGTELELKEAAKGASDNPQTALLEFADKVCDLVVLRQTLTSDVSDTGGNRALGEVHERVLAGVKASLAAWAARTLNAQLIRPMCRLNFGSEDECPSLVPSLRVTKDRKATAEGLAAARAVGIAIPRSWAYEQLDIPQPGPEDDVIEPQSQAPGLGGWMMGGDNAPDGTDQTDQTHQADRDRGGERARMAAGEPGGEDGSSGAGQRKIDSRGARRSAGGLILCGGGNLARSGAVDPTGPIEREQLMALTAAYRGAMAPFREVILTSGSREECLERLAALYRDWSPERLAGQLEEALQLAAAAGAGAGKAGK